MVDGVVDDSGFTVRDDQPELREQPDGASLVVLAQEDGRVLRLVTLTLPAATLDGEVALSGKDEGGAHLEVAHGELEETLRSDGVRVLNTTAPRFVYGEGGEVSLARDGDVLYGTFSADLEDGGWVEGAFEVAVR